MAVRHIAFDLRTRFDECRENAASLTVWRELQLDILAAVKHLRRAATDTGVIAPADVWALLEEAFWLEGDPERLACMIEEVLEEIEKECGVSRASV